MVDHDEDFSCRAAKALRAAGYSVFLAPDYRLALEILESPWPLDLLITDIVLITDILIPNSVNGFALARMARMRRLSLKVLYTTAYDFAGNEAIGKLLRKPLAMDRLVFEVGLALTTTDDSAGLGS